MSGYRYTCSNCGHEFVFGVTRRHDKCPHCGVILDPKSVEHAHEETATNIIGFYVLVVTIMSTLVMTHIILASALGLLTDDTRMELFFLIGFLFLTTSALAIFFYAKNNKRLAMISAIAYLAIWAGGSLASLIIKLFKSNFITSHNHVDMLVIFIIIGSISFVALIMYTVLGIIKKL